MFAIRSRLTQLSPRFYLPTVPALRTMSSKTIAVLNDNELKDGQMKEVAFEGEGKVLLSRLGDKIHATSAFCTHYGAPLAKGVLTADGRVVCPWHGACFNVCTGDIEDAPAPTALHSFQAHVSEGKIYVTADPQSTTKANMSRPPKLLSTGSAASTGPGVVIVGGGSGAFHAIEGLREHGYSGAITVLSKESYAPIDRTKLSKALVTDPSKLEYRSSAELRQKYGVTLRTETEVTSVDVKGKSVVVGGVERVAYETLILATGGTPRKLPIDGSNLGNIFTLRGVQDAKAIDATVTEGKRLVVIGSSFISMELVVAVQNRNLASIDVIGMESVPFEPVLGKQVGAALKKFHESKGVRFHMQSSVARITPSSSTPSAVGSVVVKGPSGAEETLPADAVIMGVGVGPATEYLRASEGVDVDRSGAVQVDEFLRVKGLEGSVYAIGDIALYPQPGTGELRRIEHWNVAGNHGRAVGKTIAEGKGQPFVKVPVFWSAQGQQLRYCGVGAGFDDVIVDGDLEALKFVVYYLKADKVIAVASMQRDPVVSKASELLRLGLMPSPAELRAGKDLLSIDISTVAAKPKVA